MRDITRIPRKDSTDGHEIVPHQANDTTPPRHTYANLDGFVNELTGIGDWSRDKTLGGTQNGLAFNVVFLTGAECENRWRGSDLGGRMIETIPNEMTREGWELSIQLTNDDEAKADAAQPVAPDDAPHTQIEAPNELTTPFSVDEEGSAAIEEMNARARDLGLVSTFREALHYERAYGGGAVLIGVDDGEIDLTKPLDETKIRGINHLTAFRGGWDGEMIAWSYYNDPREPRYGEPRVYQLRNLGVPIASPPAPGESMPAPVLPPAGPTGSLMFYAHESRFIVFPGTAVSRRARVQMRGWGDSIFTRVNEVLSQYSQTWNGVSILMQEWAQGVLKVAGLAEILSSEDPADQGAIARRAMMLQMSQSIARVRIIDAEEDFKREVTPLSGIADVLEQFSNRLAAAAGMPVSLLMGQTQGGLGDASAGDLRFFYDQIKSLQYEKLMTQVRRLYRLLFLAKDSPTKGKEPRRWHIEPKPLYQPSETELIEMRNKQQLTDIGYINAGVLTQQEVTASRFGGSKWSAETMLDLDGRQELSRMYATREAAPGALATKPEGETESVKLTGTAQGAIVKVNEARAQLGLSPMTTSGGVLDPDGNLTIAEYALKHAATVSGGTAATTGTPPVDSAEPKPLSEQVPSGSQPIATARGLAATKRETPMPEPDVTGPKKDGKRKRRS